MTEVGLYCAHCGAKRWLAKLLTSHALVLFSTSRHLSTNMILISVGTAVTGLILLVTGLILHTFSILLRGKVRNID